MARFSGRDDLYDDLSTPIPSTSGSRSTSRGILKNATEEIWIVDEEDNTMPTPDEDNLKNTEMNLYAELLNSDFDKRKQDEQVASNYADLLNQVSHLKALVAEKDAKLSALTLQDANVRKNICSLYKTARTEIDHKDSLLTEANRQLDKLLYRRNLPIDQLEKPMPQTLSEKHSEKSNEDKSAGRENPKESIAESELLNKSISDSNKKNVEQSSNKRKRSLSPPSDKKNAKIEKNSILNKNPNHGSKDSCNTVNKDHLKKQNVDTNSGKTNKTEKLGENKSHHLDTSKNIPDLAKNEHLNKKPNCDLNSKNNSLQESGRVEEPSIAEVFLRMQEMAFTDPATTNAIFFGVLPGELKQSFLDFEKSQTDALNKLKQSFVQCYFTQCNAGTASEESSGTSSAFCFQSNSKTEDGDGPSASNNRPESVIKPQATVSPLNEVTPEHNVQKDEDSVIKPQADDSVLKEVESERNVQISVNKDSDSLIKPHGSVRKLNDGRTESQKPDNNHSASVINSPGTISELNDVKMDSDMKKSGKKPAKHKPKKQDALLLHKYTDESLTLYTQRHIKRHQNE